MSNSCDEDEDQRQRQHRHHLEMNEDEARRAQMCALTFCTPSHPGIHIRIRHHHHPRLCPSHKRGSTFVVCTTTRCRCCQPWSVWTLIRPPTVAICTTIHDPSPPPLLSIRIDFDTSASTNIDPILMGTGRAGG